MDFRLALEGGSEVHGSEAMAESGAEPSAAPAIVPACRKWRREIMDSPKTEADIIEGSNDFNWQICMESAFQCAGCGEWNATRVDGSAGGRQSYVEDCQVCCRPNVLRVEYDREQQEF